MSRPRLEHLAWSKAQHGRWPLSLADSAVAAPDLESPGLPHRAGALGALETAVHAFHEARRTAVETA